MRTDDFAATAWRGGTRGLRVSKEGRDLLQRYRCRLDQEQLVVVLPGARAPFRSKLSRSFWQKCPEVRSAEIGRWLQSRGDTRWPPRNPPRYRAYLVVGKEITLKVG